MKKVLIVLVVSIFLCVGVGYLGKAYAQIGEATVTAKVDLPALLSRKTYRLGIRGGIISPTDTINVNKDSTMHVGLEFDAKLNENLDTGPRFSYISKKFQASGVNATYGVLKFGYGARIYMTYWGDYGSTHGFFNAYFDAEAGYFTANKSSETLANSPASYAGFGGSAGLGLELAFGPNTTGFVDAQYQKTSINSSAGQEFPLDGFILTIGTRLAFI